MTFRAAFCCLLLAASSQASAQVPGWPGGEQRVQVVDYRTDQVVRIQAALGYQVMVELASDERIETVAIGDSSAWQVTANKAGNLLSIKPLQTDAPTNLTIVTDVRSYNFELAGADGNAGSLPFTVRFRYPAYSGSGLDPMPSGPPIGSMIADYRVTGDKSLYPSGISDDGARTYIEWPADGPLPAVYSRDEGGAETLVNGNMRGKFFVIDGVERHLIFRIDKRRARADRLQRDAK